MYEEKWKVTKEFDGYEVSTSGRVRNKKTRMVVREQYDGRGRPFVELSMNSYRYRRSVARLVAENFIEEPRGRRLVLHRDGNRQNNYLDNLYYKQEKHESKYKLGKINRVVDEDGNERYETVRRGLKVWVVDTNYVYDTIEECAEDLGLSQKEVATAISNKELTRTGLTIKLSTY